MSILSGLSSAGVTSLKIEGRMKQEEYAVGVVRIYRKLLDRLYSGMEKNAGDDSEYYVNQDGEYYANQNSIYYVNQNSEYYVNQNEKEALLALGSRSGFTDSYLRGSKGPSMVTFTSPSHEKKEVSYTRPSDMKIKARGELILKKGTDAVFILSAKGYTVEVKGQAAEAARNRGLTKEDILDKINAFGGTPFELSEIKITADDDIFYPAGRLKELRRNAADSLLDKIRRDKRW